MSTEQPRIRSQWGYARIECDTPIAVLRTLRSSAIEGLEHVCMVLEEEQTQLRFMHVDQRELSLYLIIPQMHRARLEMVFPDRAITHEGPQAFVDFQHSTMRNEMILEMIGGLMELLRPETVGLRRKMRGRCRRFHMRCTN